VHITLKIIGGFVGPAAPDVHELDLDRLPKEAADRLRELVDRVDFSALPPELFKEKPQPWDFRHELTVSEGGRTRTVHFHLDLVPDALRELCDAVIAESDKRR